MPLITPAVTAVGVPRVLHTNVTPQNNASSGEFEDLMSWTVPGGLLANNGDVLRVTTQFSKLTNTLDALFGLSVDGVFAIAGEMPNITNNAGNTVWMDYMLIRVSASSVVLQGRATHSVRDGDTFNEFAEGLLMESPMTITLANSFTITSQGQGYVGANEFQQTLMQVVYEPTPS